jgi:hypothetical protein
MSDPDAILRCCSTRWSGCGCATSRLKDLGAAVDGERSAEPILDAAIARPPLMSRPG